MTKRRSLTPAVAGLIAGVIATLVLGASSASAATVVVNDPSGDAEGRGLDITGADLDNGDYALSTTVNFVSSRAGTVVVGLKARDRSLVRLVIRHRADGSSRSYLIDARNEPISCDGFAWAWRQARASVSFVVPSTCLWVGNYGAVKAWYLTERREGGDVDYAPERASRLQFTAWVPRG
jgi:hypothetical protein